MIRYLLVLQFPFLFLTGMIVGTGVFWVSRYVVVYYFASLLVLVAVHHLLRFLGKRHRLGRAAVPVLLGGAALASWIYRPFHLGSWDMHSLVQPWWLCGLGVFSLLAAHMAAELPPGSRTTLPAALALLGLLWIPALDYPLMPLLFVGLILAVGLAGWPSKAPESRPAARGDLPHRWIGVARYTVFLAALSVGDTVWDYHEDTRWAAHLAAALLAAAVAILVGGRLPRPILLAGVALGTATCLVPWLTPDLVIHPARTLAAGFALGAAFVYLDQAAGALDRAAGASALIGASLPWAFGLLLSVGLARHLDLAVARLGLLVPLILLLLLLIRHQRKASGPTPMDDPRSDGVAAH